MRYFLDTEFGETGLISLALVPEVADSDRRELYLALDQRKLDHEVEAGEINAWVAQHVVVLSVIEAPGAVPERLGIMRKDIAAEWPVAIMNFLAGDDDPCIVADWPTDIEHFCRLMITGPGKMIPVPALRFEVVRVDAWPNEIPGAVQHNALWDARALRKKLLAHPRRQTTAYQAAE